MFKKIFIAAAIGAVAFGAQASIVTNGSLTGDTGSYIYNGAPSTVTQFYGSVPTGDADVNGWTGSFVSIAANSSPWGNPGSLAHAAGETSGYVAGIQADGTLTQTLTDLQAGTYLLTWSDANRVGVNNSQNYTVSFNGVTLDLTPFTTTAGAGWNTESVEFTLAKATTGDLTFTGGTSYATTDATSFIDNVSVTAVPEPTSLLMMAVGTLGLLAWRRRAQV